MSDRLQGRTAIVTGAGSSGPGVGTGKAISRLYAREGARVCLMDLEAERAEETLAEVLAEGGEAFVATGDVSRAADCERVVAETVERYGKLDTLVNNVGIVPPMARVADFDEEIWDRVLTVNLKSAMLMSRAAIPRMIEAGGGAIVNISSTGAFMSTGLTPAYGAAKAAIIRNTADVAVGHGRDGIRCNAIAPGLIETPLIAGGPPEGRERRRRIAPLGVEGTAWDVAWAAVYLASDEARFVTGICIPVDGGLSEISPLTAAALVQD